MPSRDPIPDSGQGQDLSSAVTQRIDSLTSWRARFWVPLIMGLIMLGDSWDGIVIAYVGPAFRQTWNLDIEALGTVISLGYAGQFLGAIALGSASEKFGRMPVFLWSILVMCLLSLGCAFTPDKTLFFALRFFEGFALGGALPASISYVNELAPTATRGRYFAVFQFIMVAGYTLAAMTATYIVPAFGWRAMFVIGAFPALLLPLVKLTLPESPRWLMRQGRAADANRALSQLGAFPVDLSLPMAPEPAKTPISTLFGPEYRGRFAVVATLWFFTSLVAFAFSNWAPTLYTQAYHTSLKDALWYVTIASAAYFFVPLLLASILDVLGRKGPAIFCAAVALASLIGLMVIDGKQIWLVATLISTGWVTIATAVMILWPYTAEIFPTRVRATGLGLASSLARAASTLTPVVVAWVLSATGSPRDVFAILAGGTAIVLVTWIFFTRETARKSLEETSAATPSLALADGADPGPLQAATTPPSSETIAPVT